MKTVENERTRNLGLSRSTVDSNRLYSILLDARASSISENIYDVSEKIVVDEKQNAKEVLEKLWTLKKNMHEGDTGTIDLLIQHYQSKLDVLRGKEEHIKKVSKDSRGLLEEKRKKDSEIATVKQEIEDCTAEIKALTAKLEKAKIKEQELILIENQLKKELRINENEIINGLYEIILPQYQADDQNEIDQKETGEIRRDEITGDSSDESPDSANDSVNADDSSNYTDQGSTSDILDDIEEPVEKSADEIHALYVQIEKEDSERFPRSVVKTTRGVVIGEYYYDPKVYKNKRQYIYNSLYFLEQMSKMVQSLGETFDQVTYKEAQQMARDAHRRISENPNLHFEVSTNEILNAKSLRGLEGHLKEREYKEVQSFCSRLHAKIEALGSNYRIMLREQMGRYSEN
ncbi:MAG: hypothetical protein GF401_08005 [Chitinivibrionales bacterium]|nr:hypothetical protein [Chitinivibrionales bacterium]